MSRRATIRALAAALAAAVLCSAASAAEADAGLAFVGCPGSPGFGCTTVDVPLDRSGVLAGTVALSVERKLAGAAPSRDAVLALAGGPGQAVLPLDAFIAQAIAPALGARDLLLFDQRGTGASDPLSCSAFEEPLRGQTLGHVFERCALDIGPARGAFTTRESVEDIESLRRAAGYEKLVLYGTSYGTKVALEYAAQHPDRVEALVLDSVVGADGPEPLQVPTFRAIAPMLEELCGRAACAGITSSPLSELARLAARLHRRVLRGTVYDGAGRRHAAALSESGLLEILQAGDLNPALRALLPAAVRSALHRDSDPLLRLHLLSEGLIPNRPRGALAERAQPVDEALFATTSCEELPFPWQRSAPASKRLAEARAALRSHPRSDFYPFDAGIAFETGLLPDCARWPDASAPPAAPGPLPNAPTLILSGGQDLRTPTSAARSVAALIPDAQLLLVPFTGHSVIGSDLSGCADRALVAFFASSPVQPCPASPNRFAPTPVTPARLGAVRPAAGLRGRPGRTLAAVLDTLVDLNRQVIGATLQADQQLPAGASFGGLRGGYARLSSSAVMLRRFAFVQGVALNGSFPVRNGELQAASIRVSGSQASHGTVRIGSGFKRVSGKLGGHRFSIAVARVRLARAAGGRWPTLAALAPLLHRGEAPRALARASARLR